jgi:hypothetical protein
MTPLEFLCFVFRDAKQPMKRRIEAAKCAAPYVHPRLAVTPFSLPQSELNQDVRLVAEFVTPPMPPEVCLLTQGSP